MSSNAHPTVPLKENNMDTPEHQALYAQGLEMRKKVVGEDYVANALDKGKTDFLRPMQQFATVSIFSLLPSRPCCFWPYLQF
jgi:4-carboxymuconolactone decarboxylase